MIEEEGKISGYTIERNPFGGIEQNITLKDENGNTVMSHDIFMVYSHPIIYRFNKKDPDVNVTKYPELEKYKMFVDTLGAPPFYSIVNIPEQLRNSKVRDDLLLIAESSFYNSREESYLRYVHDFGFDPWFYKHIDEYINKLRSMGIDVSILIDGDRSGWEPYEAILLFRKGDNPS